MLTKGKMKRLLTKAIELDKTLVRTMSSEENPILKEICFAAKGRVDAFEAVLDAVNGNPIMLKIHAGE